MPFKVEPLLWATIGDGIVLFNEDVDDELNAVIFLWLLLLLYPDFNVPFLIGLGGVAGKGGGSEATEETSTGGSGGGDGGGGGGDNLSIFLVGFGGNGGK